MIKKESKKKEPIKKESAKREPTGKKLTKEEQAKRELALEIIDRLKKEYPDAGCTLDYNEAWNRCS